MLKLQAGLLKLFGILPIYSGKLSQQTAKQTAVSVFFWLVGVGFLLGTLYSTIFQAVFFLYGLLISAMADPPEKGHKQDPLLSAIQLMPFFAINARAFLVLLVLFHKRSEWFDLMKSAKFFIFTCFPGPGERVAVLRTAKKLSAWLCIATFALHLIWEVVEWIDFLQTIGNYTMTNDDVVAPLPMKYQTYQYIINWAVFSTLPYILSQQVFVCAIILASVLLAAVKNLNAQIEEEIVFFENTYVEEKELEVMTEKVKRWETTHARMLTFCRSVNHFFSWILFAVYGVDFITLISFTATLVKNPKYTVESYAYLAGSCIIFVMYGTLFLIPLVSVYEKSAHLNLKIHLLTCAVSGSYTNKHDSSGIVLGRFDYLMSKGDQLVSRLRHFEGACKSHVCQFNAAELIHYNRHFLVGTCTLLLSFMVLTREFFNKEHIGGD